MQQRIILKTSVLVWKCIHGVTPAYLQELCTPVPVESVQRRPRLYVLHRVDVSSCQERGREPTIWNSLSSARRGGSPSLK